MLNMAKIVVMDHPLIQHKLSILRDVNTGSKEFRALISEIANLISDGSFENVYQSRKGPWAYYKTCEIVSENGSKAMKVSEGGTVSQIISGAYDGFEYTLKAKVKGASGASIKIYFLKDSTEYIGAPTIYNLDNLTNEYGEIEFNFTAPEGCRRVEVALCGGSDHAVFDDVFMNLSKLLK